MSNWKEYQEEAAKLFRDLGCEVSTDAVIEGARTKHAVDVVVRLRRFGIEQIWIIECKLWNRRVSKETVLTLKGVVDDIGADRGILIAEAGHQAGAHSAALKTNILLTTLAALRDAAEPDLLRLSLAALRHEMAALKRKALLSLRTQTKRDERRAITRTSYEATNPDLFTVVGMIAILDTSAEEAQLEAFPVRVVVGANDEDKPLVRTADDLRQYLELATIPFEEIMRRMDEIAKAV